MARIVIDAGHGGRDYGAVYEGRREKDDNLRLAMLVGDILKQNGVDVVYTRTSDVYNTPLEKARMGNEAGADYFVSIHRNAFPTPNTVSGVETLVYNDSGVKAEMARNINSNLEQLGFVNLGVKERPDLAVLRRTQIPALLVEIMRRWRGRLRTGFWKLFSPRFLIIRFKSACSATKIMQIGC